MGFIKYVSESFEELKTNMTWISYEEAQKTTIVVATFTIIFALLIYAVDQFFQLGLTNLFRLI